MTFYETWLKALRGWNPTILIAAMYVSYVVNDRGVLDGLKYMALNAAFLAVALVIATLIAAFVVYKWGKHRG